MARWSWIFLLVCPLAMAEWDGRIVRVADGSVFDTAALGRELSGARRVVLGEKHNTAAVQAAQARVLAAVVAATGRAGAFTTAWEFLDYSAQARTADAFAAYAEGTIGGLEFLRRTQGSTRNSDYLPILEATKQLGGRLLGVNLSREEKLPVVRGGIDAADPALVPPGFELGGPAYYERFEQAMGGHARPEQIRNYFAAQSLTDDVMAYRLADAAAPLAFLVVGSFHADYFDGVVRRIERRAGRDGLVALRFVDASDHTEAELAALLVHPRYGALAHYVVFVNEPARP